MADEDLELVQLMALNARIEALHALRFDAHGREDPTVVIAIDALEGEAAALIGARADRALLPLKARIDAALAEAHRLLSAEPDETQRTWQTPAGRRSGLGRRGRRI